MFNIVALAHMEALVVDFGEGVCVGGFFWSFFIDSKEQSWGV